MSDTAARAASAQFHASMVLGALSTHGCDFEAPIDRGARVVLLGTTRGGLPLEVTVEVHAGTEEPVTP